MSWLRDHRRRDILQTPFPQAWVEHLQRNMKHWSYLLAPEQQHLKELIQVFVHEKDWEGCGGLTLTDEVRVTIAGQACLLLLGLDHVLYRHVQSILVYPDTVVPAQMGSDGLVHHSSMPILGQAVYRGPVILVWDAVEHGGRHPSHGHNVVYHEFAHKLDMLDGHVNGTPPLHSPEQYARWATVCTKAFNNLRARDARGQRTFLDPYAGVNEAEFFAVATEYFFDQPVKMKQQHAALYDVLMGFYNQDTASRQRRGQAMF